MGSFLHSVHTARGIVAMNFASTREAGGVGSAEQSEPAPKVPRGAELVASLFGDSQPAPGASFAPPPGLVLPDQATDTAVLRTLVEQLSLLVVNQRRIIEAQSLSTLALTPAVARAAAPQEAHIGAAQGAEDVAMVTKKLNLEDSLTAAEAKKVSAAVEAKVKKVASELRMRLRQFNLSIAHAQKLKDKVAVLESGKIPSGTKPFAVPHESMHYSEALGQDFSIQLNCPASTSIHDIKQKLYLQYLTQNLLLDLEVERRRQAIFERNTSFEHFLKICETALDDDLGEFQAMLSRVRAPSALFVVKNEAVNKLAGVTYR